MRTDLRPGQREAVRDAPVPTRPAAATAALGETRPLPVTGATVVLYPAYRRPRTQRPTVAVAVDLLSVAVHLRRALYRSGRDAQEAAAAAASAVNRLRAPR